MSVFREFGRLSKAQFLTKLAGKSTMFKAGGAGGDVMIAVKNGVGKGLGIVGNVVKANLATKMCFIAGTLVATAQPNRRTCGG